MPSPLSDREFELMNFIGRDPDVNQRDIARRLNLSLGMVNRLVRHLVNSGLLTMEQVDRRRVRYQLTLSGQSLQYQQSIKQAWAHIRYVAQLKQKVKGVMLTLYRQGHVCFYIWGDDEGVALADQVLRELSLADCVLRRLVDLPREPLDGPVLVCAEEEVTDVSAANPYIDLIRQANLPSGRAEEALSPGRRSPESGALSAVG